MSPFELLIAGEVSRQIIELPADEQDDALAACEAVGANPSTTGLMHWTDENGFTRYFRVVNGWTVSFRVDHADRAVRVLALDRE